MRSTFLRPILAEALRPPPRMSVSEWAEKYRVVPSEASAKAGPWKNSNSPWLEEIMDCLSPHHPARTVTFIKSAQVGGTEAALNFMMAIADMWPGPTMLIQQTIEDAQKWSRTKLAPSIKATERLNRRLVEQKSRDGSSTTLLKSFPGGFWIITGANSASGLSSHSIRFLIKDEWDKWPDDVDGQGDPDKLADQRQKTFLENGMAKTFQLSTPLIEETSRSWAAFKQGDQRKYFLPCPQCGHEQELYFFPRKQGDALIGGLRFNKQIPYEPRYACESCGVLLEQYQVKEVITAKRGKWIAQDPGEGKDPSFYINVLYSGVPWEDTVKAFLDAGDTLSKLRTFYNLELGLPWKEKGEAPPWERLYSLREDYPMRVIPPKGLVLVTACDVQMSGIYYETLAIGRDKQSWSIDIGFLPGETSDPDDGVWKELHAVYVRLYPDHYGNRRLVDAFGVDSGYATHIVYNWVRNRDRAYALDGRPGWGLPAMLPPTKQDIDYKGRKIKNGVMLWPVGIWPLKGQLYANLRKQGIKEGAGSEDPSGYCHFSTGHDQDYFQQLTAETIMKKKVNGVMRVGWFRTGQNHYHDCRIYNMALADKLKVNTMTEEEWNIIEAHRCRSQPGLQPDIFDQAAISPKPKTSASTSKPETEEKQKRLFSSQRKLWKD